MIFDFMQRLTDFNGMSFWSYFFTSSLSSSYRAASTGFLDSFSFYPSIAPAGLLNCILFVLSWLLYIHTYMQKHIQHNQDERRHFFRKIYLSLYWKRCVWEVVGDRSKIATYWPPNSSGYHSLSFLSPGLLNWGPGGPALSRELVPTAWTGTLTSISEHQSLNRGSWGPSLLGAGSLYTILYPTDSNFLCTELYYCFTPTQSLPITGQRNMRLPRSLNGMFDHHRQEITVMQFTGHPLPVHQFVTALWDFNLVPYCQSSSPTQSLPIIGQRYMHLLPPL